VTRCAQTLHKRERGFALVAAMFIVVILALLGIMMVTIGGLERATATTALRGTQAYFAARTGAEWGIFGALNNTVATCGAAPSTPTTNTFNLAVLGLDNYAVSVVCRYTEHREQSDTYNVYAITSTATSSTFGNIDFVSRILRVAVTSAPPP
jgi:MSHA biogenesis protein MshP